MEIFEKYDTSNLLSASVQFWVDRYDLQASISFVLLVFKSSVCQLIIENSLSYTKLY